MWPKSKIYTFEKNDIVRVIAWGLGYKQLGEVIPNDVENSDLIRISYLDGTGQWQGYFKPVDLELVRRANAPIVDPTFKE